MQKPDARFEAKIVIRQRPDRANLGDVAGVGIRQLFVVDRADGCVIAATEELQLAGVRDVLEEAHAARAFHTTFLVEHHRAEIDGF